MLSGKTIGVIGAGTMGEILIRGLLQSGRVREESLFAFDINRGRLEYIAKTYGIGIAASNAELVRKSAIVLIGVKPQNVDGLLDEMPGPDCKGRLFISIAAGVSIETIAGKIPPESTVVRAMPNAPASVLAGVTALCPGKNVSPDDLGRAIAIFDCVGRTVTIKNEDLMNAVTGLSGSGPAYVFMLIESLSDAGVRLGISRRESSILAAQTVYGAAKMALETEKHPGELRDLVSTPGGTTVAGLKMLEKGCFRATVLEAVEAAAERSRELGKNK